MADQLDMSGVTMDISGQALANALIPHLVTALAGNMTLQRALVDAILPGIQQQVLTLARATANTGTLTPRTP